MRNTMTRFKVCCIFLLTCLVGAGAALAWFTGMDRLDNTLNLTEPIEAQAIYFEEDRLSFTS